MLSPTQSVVNSTSSTPALKTSLVSTPSTQTQSVVNSTPSTPALKTSSAPSTPAQTPKTSSAISASYAQNMENLVKSATLILDNGSNGAEKLLNYLSTTYKISGNPKIATLISNIKDIIKGFISFDNGVSQTLIEDVPSFVSIFHSAAQEFKSKEDNVKELGTEITNVVTGHTSFSKFEGEVSGTLKQLFFGSKTISSASMVSTVKTDLGNLSSSITNLDVNSAQYTQAVQQFINSATTLLNTGSNATEELLGDLSTIATACGSKQLATLFSLIQNILKGYVGFADSVSGELEAAIPGFVAICKSASEEFQSKLGVVEKEIGLFGDAFFGNSDSHADLAGKPGNESEDA